jgi:hypothetical protein
VQALGLVVAYDMYCEAVQEGFAAFGFENKDAANKCVLNFLTFRDKLSLQGLQYTPEDCKYKGDRGMRMQAALALRLLARSWMEPYVGMPMMRGRTW